MATRRQTEDRQWMARALAGDDAAFAQMMERYHTTVQHEVEQLLPADTDMEQMVQDVFVHVQQKLSTFDPTGEFEPWLREVCVDYCQQQAQETLQNDPSNAMDATLVRRTLAGERQAFDLLVERYQRDVYTHAYYRLNNAHDAQEAAQDIFYRAYVKLEMFDLSRRFRAWLLTIASNYCTDMLRRRWSLKRFAQQVSLDAVDFVVSDTSADPERLALRSEQRELVRQALRRLPDKYREVMVLFYWNDLSYREIEDVTGLKESTIKTRLHRAREQLLGLLSEQGVSR